MSVNLPSLQDITATSQQNEGDTFINGSNLKIMHKNRQPNDRQLQFNTIQGTPYFVSVQQKISGPSSEIVFQTKPISSKGGVEQVIIFLEKILELVIEKCDRYLEKHEDVSELQSILESVTTAMFEGEKSRLCEKESDHGLVWMSLEEAREMMAQVHEQMKHLESGNKVVSDSIQELASFLRSVTLICYDDKDRHFNR